MLRKIAFMLLVLALGLIMAVPAFADGPVHKNADVTIFVTGQELYYDSIVGPDLPPGKGPFQLLEVVDGQLQTEFGPGDQGYVGGRWMMDSDGDGEIDKWFSCPLLGPGRTHS